MPKKPAAAIKPEHIEVVHACHQTCLTTIKHCLTEGGKHVEGTHLTLLMDCEGICHLHEDFLLRGSHHHHAMCKACEEICDECAQSCEAFKGDKTMAACAQACRRCAEVCRMM
jgi:hypothetical protein